MLKQYFNILKKNDIGEPPWNYYFLLNLEESEYPKYLAKLFYLNTGEKLDLKHPKTFNQKIQWIKLYGVTDLMKKCTDKVTVREYVREKIGEEYLKPVLQVIPPTSKALICPPCGESGSLEPKGGIEQNYNKDGNANDINFLRNTPPYPAKAVLSPQGGQICEDFSLDVSNYFDQIDFDKLPNAFVIKCNHGCKWHFIIKNKVEFTNTPKLINIVKEQLTGWLEQSYFVFGMFEFQYKNIQPKIIIEKLLRNSEYTNEDLEIFCSVILYSSYNFWNCVKTKNF